jgi:hypothetical protein
MFINSVFRSRVLVVGVLAAFMLLVAPVREFAQTQAPLAGKGGGSLVGFIYEKDMKTPVANAIIKIRDVATPKEYASLPTDANGMYKITGITEGRYIIGVASPTGSFNFDYVLILKGSEMAKLSVALSPGGQTTGVDAKKKSFFLTPAGIVLIVVAVGAVLYAVLSNKEEASPIR